MINLKLQYIVYLAFLIILNVVQAEQTKLTLSVEELKYLATEIKAAEKRLHNIKIESEAWVEEKADLSDPCEPWQRTPIYISSTAWFTGNWSYQRWNSQRRMFESHIEGKARVDFHKEVLEWENGAAPYLESNYSVSFDGQYGRYIRNSTSYGGKVFHINKWRVLPDVPHQLRSKSYQRVVGIKAFLNFHFRSEEEKFSSLFQYVADPNYALKNGEADPNFAVKNTELEVTFQKIRGVECINISLKGKRYRESWWLDPNRDFALLKHENTRNDKDGSEVLVDSIDVRKLNKVAENIWCPVEVYFVTAPFGIGNSWKRTVYRAINVVANDPNFSDSIFTVPIPEGYSVDGTEYKTVYTGGKTESCGLPDKQKRQIQ